MPRLKTTEEKNEYVKSLKGTMSDTELRRKVREVFKVGKSQGNEIFRKIFNLKATEEFRQSLQFQSPSKKKTSFFKTNGDKAVAEIKGVEEIKTLEDLVAYCNIDLDVWKSRKFIANIWDNKLQVKAEFERRKDIVDRIKILEEFKSALSEIPVKNFEVSPQRDGYLYEISMADIHLGKLAWAEETKGENYDSTIAVNRAKEAVGTLLGYVDLSLVEKFLLPIGNDLFNSDNAAATTTAGTPQHEDSRWQNTFMKGAKLFTEIVEYLTTFAPVDIVIVQGNHDHERSFYLGEYLSAWFRSHLSVHVNNEPSTRKYYKWNQNLIGMTHGNEEKHADLPLIMATEKPQDWAATKWHFFQLGHWHKEKLEDIKGVKVHVLPSFCEQDAWHTRKGYIGNDRAAEGLLFDKELGLIANFYYRVG